MLPTKQVPEHHLNTWHADIQERLCDEFSKALNASWGHFEFKMIRDKSGRTGPCIIFIGWDEASCMTSRGRDRARRKFKRLLGSMESLKGCPFPVEVVIDRTSLLGSTAMKNSVSYPETFNLIGAVIEARIDQYQHSFAGI